MSYMFPFGLGLIGFWLCFCLGAFLIKKEAFRVNILNPEVIHGQTYDVTYWCKKTNSYVTENRTSWPATDPRLNCEVNPIGISPLSQEGSDVIDRSAFVNKFGEKK